MIAMNNLENLATAIGTDIKDIKTQTANSQAKISANTEAINRIATQMNNLATKSEVYNDTEIKQRLITLEAKHYLTEHQSLTHLVTNGDFDYFKQTLGFELNDFKGELLAKVNHFQDTEWIEVAGEEYTGGNIVHLRRIGDVVYVSIGNKHNSNSSLSLKYNDEEQSCVLLKMPAPIGFNPTKTIVQPVFHSENYIISNPEQSKSIGLAVLKVENEELTIKLYGEYFKNNESDAYINYFSYFTRDDFPDLR